MIRLKNQGYKKTITCVPEVSQGEITQFVFSSFWRLWSKHCTLLQLCLEHQITLFFLKPPLNVSQLLCLQNTSVLRKGSAPFADRERSHKKFKFWVPAWATQDLIVQFNMAHCYIWLVKRTASTQCNCRWVNTSLLISQIKHLEKEM